MPRFTRDDLTLYYTERGRGDGPPLVLTHGLLLSSHLMKRVAALLPDQRVLLLDLHGHGRSSKPTDPGRYTWAEMAADVVGLLDHLGIEAAAVGGMSLGANVTLATAQRYPDRVTAMIIEMPVLERGHPAGRTVFGGLASFYAASRVALGPLAAVARRVPLPRRLPELAAARDIAGNNPAVAAAILRGLVADDPIAEDEATLAALTMPALVVGHPHDPLHVLDDARQLAERLPNGRFLQSGSLLDYRVRPHLLAAEIRQFLAEVS